MPIQAGSDVVFDLAYYDYAWWTRLDEAGCRLVTRLKSNTPRRLCQRLPVARGGDILSDRIGRLPERLAGRRKNPMQKPVREIRVRISTGKVLRIVPNDVDAPASEIAALYRQRWQIELFFKWIKHFLGTSGNAICIQISVALISFLLLKLAHVQQTAVQNLTVFARLVSANLMHRKPLDRLWRTGSCPIQCQFTTLAREHSRGLSAAQSQNRSTGLRL